MLVVKTKIQQSPIHGIGLFATEFIPKGTLIWKLKIGFDIIIDENQFLELPKITQDYIIHFSYFHKDMNCHIVPGDNARFFNKSETPNCGGDDDDNTFALVDIREGEELTELYFNHDEIKNIKNKSE